MVNAPEARWDTNTLILVPKPTSSAALFNALRPHFEKFGLLRIWAPLLGFNRCLAIFANDIDAELAKQTLDRSVVEERVQGQSDLVAEQVLLRVYAGPRTPEALLLHPSLQQNGHLPVPASDKNFLISPPGSPPVGWEQIREDPPNVDTLADDLMRALEGLGGDDQMEETVEEPQSSISSLPASPKQRSPRDTLIVAAPEDNSLPSVMVSNLEDDEPRNPNGLTISNTPNGIRRAPTPRPGDISAVKATVESMNGPTRITPTARPPMNGY